VLRRAFGAHPLVTTGVIPLPVPRRIPHVSVAAGLGTSRPAAWLDGVGVMGADTGVGTELSEAVSAALPEVVAAVMAELEASEDRGQAD